MVKSLKWEIFIDRQNYYMRKLIVLADLEVDDAAYLGAPLVGTSTTLSEKSKATFAFAFKSGAFGENVIVDIPQETMTFEEFTNLLSEVIAQAYSGLLTPEELPDVPLDEP
jgi:hypothetical protein